MPAEAKGIAQGHFDLHFAGLVGHVVQVTLGIRVVEIDRRRQELVADGEYRENGFYNACSAQQVSWTRDGTSP